MAILSLSSHSLDSAHHQLIEAARERWIQRLINLTRRNPLLYFRERSRGTLDFRTATKSIVAAFLKGERESVSSRQLFPDAQHDAALRNILEIRKRARAYREEKGVETLYLAVGQATWTPLTPGRPPAAPILLLPIEIEALGRNAEARLQRAGVPQINSVLLYALAQEYGRTNALTLPNDIDADTPDVLRFLGQVILRLRVVAHSIPGFNCSIPIVLGTFAFQKLAIVTDLRQQAEAMAAHNVIAAIVGDSQAREAIMAAHTLSEPRHLDRVAPDREYLIRDADSSQQRVIAAVLAGQSGVIQGPPGTGKSQTIANLITTLAAHGKRVLFVAEKQAALEVVQHRLQEAKLGHLALNLHSTDTTHRILLNQIDASLKQIRAARPVDTDQLHHTFTERRQLLNNHVSRLHRVRLPADLSVYHIHGELLNFPEDIQTQTRWRGADLAHITVEAADRVRTLLIEASGFDDLFLGLHSSPWTYAKLTDDHHVQATLALLARLARKRLPALLAATSDAATVTGLPPPITVGQILLLIDLLPYIADTLNNYRPDLFDEDLMNIVQQLAPADEGRLLALWTLIIDTEYRGAYRTARSHAQGRGIIWPWNIRSDMDEAAEYQQHWRTALGDEVSVPERSQVEAAHAALMRAGAEEAWDDLMMLAALFPEPLLRRRCGAGQLDEVHFDHLRVFLDVLQDDTNIPYRVPQVRAIRQALAALGVQPLISELRIRRARPDQWEPIFDHAWLTSCLEQAYREDSGLTSFNGVVHERFVADFRRLDTERIARSADRVRRAHAEHAIGVMNTYRSQVQLLQEQIPKRRQQLPMRQLLPLAAEVLTAVCPCWMASPLTVSQFIPADRPYFDVVIFDEASQVVPEDAIAALLRGKTVVVAGDQHQLPPTLFFAASNSFESTDEETDAPEQGYESLLDMMVGIVDPWPLEWHYRSYDESLIAFANRHIYDNRLVTSPNPSGTRAVRHELVEPIFNDTDAQEESSASEVRRVVELILDHMERCPMESLGVITLGIKHMERVQTALDIVREQRQDLDPFFGEDRDEHFFVKNLERVQGDERDAIILSVGYTKNRSGKLPYRFGPLLLEGGHRRLNVAITRARRRMTIVSSFAHTDMDPHRRTSRGVSLLRQYLEYAAEGGTFLREVAVEDEALDAFEKDVYEVLTAHGIPIQPQVGTSSARISFAARHPERLEEYVLAIECDGPTYYATATARDRDRLRQQQLEALGWAYHRIWALDWYRRRDEVIERITAAYVKAVHAADLRYAAADSDPEPDPIPIPEEQPDTEPLPPRASRPHILPGYPIGNYRPTQIVALVRWIRSDGLLRTDDEIMEELRQDLGFQRLGTRMKTAFQEAIDLERRSRERSA